MPDRFELARGWFLKAESDLKTAKRMEETEGPYDTACCDAQQAVEKYLKGLLVLHGKPFARTHNLEELQRTGESLPSWPMAGLDLTQLSSYAVEIRYDFEFWPDRPAAQEAIALALEVRRRVMGSVPANVRL